MKISELAEAPLPIYTHRNGETEPPTEPGYYWFSGSLRYTHPVFMSAVLCLDDHGFFGCGEEVYSADDSWNGQWWGPVTPPWETSE